MGFPANTPRPSFNRLDKRNLEFGVTPLGEFFRVNPPEGGTPNIVSPFIDSADFHYAKFVDSQLGQLLSDGFPVGRFQMHCEDIHSVMTKLMKLFAQHSRRE